MKTRIWHIPSLALAIALASAWPAPRVLAATASSPAHAPLAGEAWNLADQAYKAYDAKEYALAQAKAAAAIRLRPDVVQLRLLLVYALQKQGMQKEAALAATQAVKAGLNDPVLHGLKNKTQRPAHNKDTGAKKKAAVPETDAFRQAYPIATQAYSQYKSGHYPASAQLAEKAFMLDPRQGVWALLWLDALSAQGKSNLIGKAIDVALAAGAPNKEQLLARRPAQVSRNASNTDKAANTSASKAYAAYARGDYQEAIAQARIAASHDHNPPIQRLLTTALAAGDHKQNIEALQRLDNELATHPGEPDLLMQRGYLHQRLKQPGDALKDFHAARESGRAPASAILDEAYAQANVGDKRAATRNLEQAIDNADAGKLDLDARQRYSTRADIAGLSREWGAYVSSGYRGARAATTGLGGAPVAVPGDAVFSTAEVYWRPSLFINTPTQVLELYGRVSNTLHDNGSRIEPQDNSCLATTCESGKFRSVSGFPSTTGALGIRYTPSTKIGLTFGLERQMNLGSATRQGGVGVTGARQLEDIRKQYQASDLATTYQTDPGSGGWLSYITYAFYNGTQLRTDVPNWLTMEGYAQAGYLSGSTAARFQTNGFYQNGGTFTSSDSGRIIRDQAFIASEFRVGRSFRADDIDNRLVIYPHLVIAADKRWDKIKAQQSKIGTVEMQGSGSSWALGAGAGVTLRYWWREDHYNAPRSYLDWTIQYRGSIGGGAADRAKGLFMNLTLSY